MNSFRRKCYSVGEEQPLLSSDPTLAWLRLVAYTSKLQQVEILHATKIKKIPNLLQSDVFIQAANASKSFSTGWEKKSEDYWDTWNYS